MPSSTSPIPVPGHLAEVLSVLGLRGAIALERLDGKPVTAEQEQLARNILARHGRQVSDAEVSAKAKAYLEGQVERSATPAPRSSGKAPTTRTKAPGKGARKSSKASPRKAARRPSKG